MKKNNTISLSELVDQKIGKKGARKREKFEAQYEAFKLGGLLQHGRQQQGLTEH